MNDVSPKWAIFNKEGNRLVQFGSARSEDDAIRLLKRAQTRYPEAGCHIKRIDIYVS